MRGRATVAGLSLAALLGVGVVAACTAAAATPEFKLCTMAEPAHTGKYSQNTCANSSFVPDGGQKFEREGFPFAKAKKLSFRDGTSGERFESIVNPSGGGGPSTPGSVEGVLDCELRGKPGSGQITGPNTVTFFEIFRKCRGIKEDRVCASGHHNGRNAEIVTDMLEGTLVYLNAEHTRVGMRVKGLGPGGQLIGYTCSTINVSVDVVGEFLAELTGNVNSASKLTKLATSEGPLRLQEPMYEEEAFSEQQGKEYLEYEDSLESCEKGEAPYPGGEKSPAECEPLVGSAPVQGPPIVLIAKTTGLSRERLEVTQRLDVARKGELFLVEAS